MGKESIRQVVRFADFFVDDTKSGVKIPQSKYASQGRNVIIDQGDNNVAGYSDSDDGLYTSVPVVVFGNHTRIVKYVDRPFFIGADGGKILKPQNGVNPLYAFYALKAAHIDSLGYSRHFKLVKELTFALADVKMQERIAATLDKICELKKNAETRLEKLDLLVKSRFVEMFGDPMTNPKRWPKKKMVKVIDRIGNGRSFVCESFARTGENPAILKLGAATWGVYKPEENKALKAGVTYYPDCEVKPGDLLFTRKNTLELVGKCAYVRETPPKLMLPDLIFRLETNERIDKLYLANLINHDGSRAAIQRLASGSAGSMPNISKARLLGLAIPLPPLPLTLQREFAAFVEKVDKLKDVAKKSVEQMDVLYRSKLQEYFG